MALSGLSSSARFTKLTSTRLSVWLRCSSKALANWAAVTKPLSSATVRKRHRLNAVKPNTKVSNKAAAAQNEAAPHLSPQGFRG